MFMRVFSLIYYKHIIHISFKLQLVVIKPVPILGINKHNVYSCFYEFVNTECCTSIILVMKYVFIVANCIMFKSDFKYNSCYDNKCKLYLIFLFNKFIYLFFLFCNYVLIELQIATHFFF